MEATMWYRKICLFALLLALSAHLNAQQRYNLGLLKRDTQIFEQIIEEVLKQNFKTPFALAADPKGAYLQGYGLTISFQLNLNRAGIRTPFGQLKGPMNAGPKLTSEEQVKIVKDAMITCLANYGRTVKELRPRDRISIHAHMTNRSELDPIKSETVLVMTVMKEHIDQLSAGTLDMERFKQRVHILQY